MKTKRKSYYKETLPDLVAKLKTMLENSLEVVSKNIDPATKENELKAALESRKLAVEDVIWSAKEIGRMKFELGGDEEKDAFSDLTYLTKVIPRLIKELKGMVDNNLDIVDKTISKKLKESGMKSALVSRRLAAEHAVWASKKVDELEKILIGESEDDSKDETVIMNWTKRKAKLG
ncbi:hypothetical protein [Aquimarina algiphila]|uniref:Uncharacterized protein n=1 Tax=Aquimarina algiphila TaxID=2047982 RepID=A0A554VRL2_9FLAO|nr:hypothetical protein [Aquimarina algiphila]TSE11290.1 hypothetical protein FOF46_01280 [Aquimarina algiphila]